MLGCSNMSQQGQSSAAMEPSQRLHQTSTGSSVLHHCLQRGISGGYLLKRMLAIPVAAGVKRTQRSTAQLPLSVAELIFMSQQHHVELVPDSLQARGEFITGEE
jgi:hypothetical protein